MTFRATAVWLLLPGGALAGGGARQELSLSGQWERQIVLQQEGDLTTPPKTGKWQPCAVPGYLRGPLYTRVWLRRSFTLPASVRGKRLKIHFGGVKYNSRVYVNGKHVGGCFGGYRPFGVDVTDAVRFNRPNELAVGVHDWTGIFSPGRFELPETGGSLRLRNAAKDKVLAPLGGLYSLFGIWDDVTLRAYPAVYVKDLFIRPSVRREELVVDYTLANESAADAEVDLDAVIEDRGHDAIHLPKLHTRVRAGGTAARTVRMAWPDAHLWSHVDPYLYQLRTELSTGDVLRTRFGFREFWVEGHRFYLNGVRINLLATSWWPPHSPMKREEIRRRWEAIKRCGCVAFRTHTQPWRPVHYDVADEIGLLMIVEGAVWNDENSYRLDDPVFWENYAEHLKAMVHRDKNRPSVIMWSLENEFYGGRFTDEHPAKADLVRMGRIVKQTDPTRPIMYESDGDPGGVADVIGIHYPHEYPHHTCWPNEAYWLAKPHPFPYMFREGEEEFFWRKKKPLYIGEFLWLPSSNPSWHTVFFGDDAYVDYRPYRNMGKGESWKMQILGYRHHEVGGISPWTVIEGGPLDETNFLYQAHQYAYQHIAAYCHDYDRRFYSGERVARRVEVFNDILEASALDLKWTLAMDGKVVDRGGEKLDLGPAEKAPLDVILRMPEVERRTPVEWRLTIDRNGKRVFDDTHGYAVFGHLRLPFAGCAGGAEIGLYDPKGDTKKIFEEGGLRPRGIDLLDRLDRDLEVLVIGAGTLGAGKREGPVIGRIAPERAALQDFVARGGRVLVLEQEAYPGGLFDIGLSAQKSTMTFPMRLGHPALRGVERDDLKFWRGDHMVATNEPARPVSGAALSLVVSGSAAGIDTAPLVERPIGRGCFVHSQLKLVEKFASEPTAARVLVNLMDYLVRYRPTLRKTGVARGSEKYHAYLRGLGLRFDELDRFGDDLTGKLTGEYSLLLCRGEVSGISKLRRFVEGGGNLIVHRVPPDGLDELCRAFDIDAVLHPCSGPVSRAEGDDALFEAVTREDLYWLGEHVGISWAETPRATGMAEGAFAKTLEGKQTKGYEVEEWKLRGKIVEARGGSVTFATVGSATGEIDFAVTGTYIVGVVARGSPCHGVYPIARISIDGEALGSISVAADEWRTYTTFGRVEKGRRSVSVAFVNDGRDPPEDRNLYVDKVLIARDDRPTGVTFLTSPPAVAFVRRGRGTLVIDQLRWDTEEANARKAARYVCSLLSALGGDFTPRLSVALECEHMTPNPEMNHFHKRGSFVSLACNGYIETQIQVAAAGRYTIEVVASGTQAEDVYPLVEVRVDGRKVGEVQLTSGAWRPYPLSARLAEGTHTFALAFVNDRNVPGVADRNLALDKALFHRE